MREKTRAEYVRTQKAYDEQKKEDAQQATKERKARHNSGYQKSMRGGARDRIAAAIAQAIATQRNTDEANRVLLDEAIEYAVELLNQEREA